MEDAQPPSPEQTPSPLPKPVELEEWSKPSVESRKFLPTVDPRSKLYPFPDDNGFEHETRPLLPLNAVASSSPASPRIFQDPSLSTNHSRFRIPSPLPNHSPTATLHLSTTATTVPYPEEPEKLGQLVWLDLKTASAEKALGRRVVVKRAAIGFGHPGAMQARRMLASARDAAQREAGQRGPRGPRRRV
ncbi:hypothetical protein L202_08205 [Cryptococcus amylolentus CBS 6039]|uniref:Uncharacterized protein n=1 Tax=Cryptococcus amylolentus CBS 6039 TaxID=1295533 RepID=A0A1E3H8X0_9TREE|nr:hypothetical protein L202_08205 [Cryptococcus amylolentus CBS 6039]ODN72770.1 hypothetical protein L202_08205 [Cryptococcus amylolentus CBS 6039]